MKARLIALTAGIPPRTLLLVMTAVLLLIAFEGWLLALRGPWTDYQRIRRATQTAGATAVHSAAPVSSVHTLENEIEGLVQRVKAASTELSPDQLVLMAVDRLSNLAQLHGVTLGGVRAGGVRRVLKFEELSVDIQTSGRYQNLVALLHDVQYDFKPMAVSQFVIRQADATAGLDMQVKLVAYRALEAAEPGK